MLVINCLPIILLNFLKRINESPFYIYINQIIDTALFLHHEWNFININIRVQNRNLYSGNIVFYINWMQLQRDLINT